MPKNQFYRLPLHKPSTQILFLQSPSHSLPHPQTSPLPFSLPLPLPLPQTLKTSNPQTLKPHSVLPVPSLPLSQHADDLALEQREHEDKRNFGGTMNSGGNPKDSDAMVTSSEFLRLSPATVTSSSGDGRLASWGFLFMAVGTVAICCGISC